MTDDADQKQMSEASDAMTATAEMILAAAGEDAPPIVIPEVGFLHELSGKAYHSDPCEAPSLSASIAHILVTRSPLHAWHRHPRLGGGGSKSTKSMTDGTVVHELLLGGDRIRAVAHKDFRTKAAKAERDEHVAMGRVPILKHKLDPLRAVADTIRERMLERGIDFADPGMATEVSAFWQSDGVQCRGRLDALWIAEADDCATVYDLKLTQNAHPSEVERTIERYGYATQATAYLDAVQCIRPDLEGRVRYEWIFVEPEQPNAMTFAEPDGILEQLGESRWQRAKELWSQCLELHDWPDYAPRRTVRVGAPPWVIAKELEQL
jgi:hypothetical protein